MCKQTSPHPNRHLYAHPHPTSKHTNILSVYVPSCTHKGPQIQKSEGSQEHNHPCLCSSSLSTNQTNRMINDSVCFPSFHPSYPSIPPSLHSSVPFRLLPVANIYPGVYLGSMQSWMSATHEFFCKESMVSRMYSPPFSTCRSRKHPRHTLSSVHPGKLQR